MRQEAMRPTSVLRFVLYGAIGFGIGWAVAGLFNVVFAAITDPMFQPGSEPPPGWATWPPYFAYLFAGACGGAGLGLALGRWKRALALAVAGGAGFGVGFLLFFILAFLFGLRELGVAMGVGLFGGVTLGLTFVDWKRVLALALAGLVGFGIGGAIAAALRIPFAIYPFLADFAGLQDATLLAQQILVQAVVGLVGGASLGAALGYLESRKPVEERSPRVR
jgi:hypothetical protein